MNIDPTVELLDDAPIQHADDDRLDRRHVAARIVELAAAAPATRPRVVALIGPPGSGKTSTLNLATALVVARPELATLAVDVQLHASAQAVMKAVAAELQALFDDLGVAGARDKLRDTLISYGGIVSGLIRIAGVKVDVTAALERSAASLREEIARHLEQAGKRVVIVVDHLDQLAPAESDDALAALRMYAAIPYLAIIIALDRRGTDPRAFERLVHVELALPPAPRAVLAGVLTTGIARIAARIRRDLTPVVTLFDSDDSLGLALLETPRDAVRALNALSAALPLLPSDANLYLDALEVVLRVLVPEIDGARLAARRRLDDAGRQALFAELAEPLARHPRAAAAREALGALVLGT